MIFNMGLTHLGSVASKCVIFILDMDNGKEKCRKYNVILTSVMPLCLEDPLINVYIFVWGFSYNINGGLRS